MSSNKMPFLDPQHPPYWGPTRKVLRRESPPQFKHLMPEDLIPRSNQIARQIATRRKNLPEATSQPLDLMFIFELPGSHTENCIINNLIMVDLARPKLRDIENHIEERYAINLGKIEAGQELHVERRGVAHVVPDHTVKWKKRDYPFEAADDEPGYWYQRYETNVIGPDGETMELCEENWADIESMFMKMVRGEMVDEGMHLLVYCALQK